MRFKWEISAYGGLRAEMPNNVTLIATPDRTKGLSGKPARGTTWRAQCSQWEELARTISGFGRDEYAIAHKTKQDAMRAAESIYSDKLAECAA